MRKIESVKERERKKRKNQLIVGGVLIILMILSTAGFAFQSNFGDSGEKTIEYNGFKFTGRSGGWRTELGAIPLLFVYEPGQTPEVEAELNPIEEYFGKKLYLYSDDFDAENEIQTNLGQVVDVVERACPRDVECEENLQMVDGCKDNFIIIRVDEKSEVLQEESCVYIRGPKEKIVRLTDAFLFDIIGIK